MTFIAWCVSWLDDAHLDQKTACEDMEGRSSSST